MDKSEKKELFNDELILCEDLDWGEERRYRYEWDAKGKEILNATVSGVAAGGAKAKAKATWENVVGKFVIFSFLSEKAKN